jgi:hypothetical protein
MISFVRFAALLGGLIASLAPIHAQTLITLTPASVIGGSPIFFQSVYNSGSSVYQAGNIFNQQSGAVNMSSQAGNAWFPDDTYGLGNRFVTIDLGASYVLSSIQIFNSNQADRATGSFSLSAGNSITVAPTTSGFSQGQMVGSPTTLLAATALTNSTSTPVTGQTFPITDPTAYRYLTLRAIDFPSSGGFVNAGLAEVRFYSAIPEPSTYAAIFGAAALGFAVWRRRRAAGAAVIERT